MNQIGFQENLNQSNQNPILSFQSYEQSNEMIRQQQQCHYQSQRPQYILHQKQRQQLQRQSSLNKQQNFIFQDQDHLQNPQTSRTGTISKIPSLTSQIRSSSKLSISQINHINKDQLQKNKNIYEKKIEINSAFQSNEFEPTNGIKFLIQRPEFFNKNEWENIPDNFEEYEKNGNQLLNENILGLQLQSTNQKDQIYNKSFNQHNKSTDNKSNSFANNFARQIQQRYRSYSNQNKKDNDNRTDQTIQFNQTNIQIGKQRKLVMQRSESEANYKNIQENQRNEEKKQKSEKDFSKKQKTFSNQNDQMFKFKKQKRKIIHQKQTSKSLEDLDNQNCISQQNKNFKTESYLQELYKSELNKQENNGTKLANGINKSGDNLGQNSRISLYNKINIIRRWIFLTFEDPTYSCLSKIIYFFIQFTVVFSCVIFIISTVYLTNDISQDDINFGSTSNSSNTTEVNQTLQNYIIFQKYAEIIVSAIFTSDLFLRLSCCSSFGISIKAYLKQPVNLIDLISIIPFYMVLVFSTTKIKSLQILRIVRLLRIIRIFKLSKYIKGFSILYKALRRSKKQLIFVLNLVLIIAIFAATLIYYLENHLKNSSLQLDNSQPDVQIESIPQALWFTIVTMSTVGYGDKIPCTILGQLLTMCIAFIGNALMIGLPIAIISYDFQVIYKEEKEKEKFKKIKIKSIEQIKKLQSQMYASQNTLQKNFQMTEENQQAVFESQTQRLNQNDEKIDINSQNHQNSYANIQSNQNNFNQRDNQEKNNHFQFNQIIYQSNQSEAHQPNFSNDNFRRANQNEYYDQSVQQLQQIVQRQQNNSFSTQSAHQNNENKIDEKQQEQSKRSESQFGSQEQQNNQDIQIDDDLEAQIVYMVNRLKQISKTNKAIRELTFQISKMSYIVTLDIAKLYQAFSLREKLQTDLLKEPNDIVYMTQKCENTKNSLLKQRFTSIIAFQKNLANNFSTKISLNQLKQLNQASLSKKGTLNSNTYAFSENINSNSFKFQQSQISQHHHHRTYSGNQKTSYKYIKSSDSIPRSPFYQQSDKNLEFSHLKKSQTLTNDTNVNKQNTFIQSTRKKNNSKSEFFKKFSEYNNTNRPSRQFSYSPDERNYHNDYISSFQYYPCQSENFVDDDLREQENKLYIKKIKNQSFNFMEQLNSKRNKQNQFNGPVNFNILQTNQSRMKDKQLYETEVNSAQNSKTVQKSNQFQNNSISGKSSTKEDSETKKNQKIQQNIESSLEKNILNKQQKLNFEQNLSFMKSQKQKSSSLNNIQNFQFNKQNDQMISNLQKIDAVDEDYISDQILISRSKQFKSGDYSSSRDFEQDKVKMKKQSSSPLIKLKNNFKENEEQQSQNLKDQITFNKQSGNNQISKAVDRRSSQFQSIIQDLLLNISQDIQEYEDQKSHHIQSIKNIENQKQLSNLLKGVDNEDLFYKVPQN